MITEFLGRLRARVAELDLPPAWVFGLIGAAAIGLLVIGALLSRVDPFQAGVRTGLLVGATVGFLIGLTGLPAGLLASTLLRFGVARYVMTEFMVRGFTLGLRLLVFSVAVLAGLLFAGASDPVAFPWLVVGLAVGMLLAMWFVLVSTFLLASVVGMVIAMPFAIRLDRFVGDDTERGRPFWAVRQRLADRFWRPPGGEPDEAPDLAGSETVVFIAPTPLEAATAMLDFIDRGYRVSFATPDALDRPDRLPKDPRLFIGSRSVLAPWTARPGRPDAAMLGSSNLIVGLHALYPKAKFLIADDDDLARRLGAPSLTYHAHASLGDGPLLLAAGRESLGRHAPFRRARILDWLERRLIPAASLSPRPPEIRLMQAGVIPPGRVETAPEGRVMRAGRSLGEPPAELYEVTSWQALEAAEAQIRADGVSLALLHGPHDMRDGGWMVYLDGINQGEVGSIELALGLVRELTSRAT